MFNMFDVLVGDTKALGLVFHCSSKIHHTPSHRGTFGPRPKAKIILKKLRCKF